MPRFYFNVHDGRSELDTEGSELPSGEAARLTALQLAGAILKDEAHRQKLGETWRVEAVDEAGVIICRIAVSLSDPSAGEWGRLAAEHVCGARQGTAGMAD